MKRIPCFLALGALAALVTGCGTGEDSRQPTKSDIDASNQTRLQNIDKMNLPDSVKAQMKAHMGGPPAADAKGQPKPGPKS